MVSESEFQDSSDGLQQEINELHETIEALEQEKQGLVEENEILKQQITQLEDSQAENASVSSSQASLPILVEPNEIENLKALVAKLEKQVHKSADEIADWSAKYHRLQSIQQSEKAATVDTVDSETLQNELAHWQESVANLQRERNTLTQRTTELKKTIRRNRLWLIGAVLVSLIFNFVVWLWSAGRGF